MITCGIDIGTTRTKVTLLDNDANILGSHAFRYTYFSGFIANPDNIFQTVIHLVKYSINQLDNNPVITTFAVSAHAPTLCAFNPANPKEAICISYAFRTKLPSHLSNIQKTCKQIKELQNALLHMDLGENFDVASLTGYLNIRLGSTNSLDPITAWEFGLYAPHNINHDMDDTVLLIIDKLKNIPCLAAYKAIKTQSPFSSMVVNVLTGTTDTIASILSLRCPTTPKFMIYSGTFGSLLKLNSPLHALLANQHKSAPYDWLVSFDDFGETFTKLANKSGNSLQSFFEHINYLLLLPNEKSHTLVNNSGSTTLPNILNCDSDPVLKGFHIFRIFCTKLQDQIDIISDKNCIIHATGGLASIPSYCKALQIMLDCEITFPELTNGSYGTALLTSYL